MTSQSVNVWSLCLLSRIAKIRDSVSTTVCKSLMHGLVTSRTHYVNAILFGISDRHLHRLEMVQLSAARIVMQIRRGDRQSMTTIVRQLHWLPEYLAALLLQHAPRRSLRSAGGLLLEVPKVNLERLGCRAFACAGPIKKNSLGIYATTAI